jgi:hypothetical protein
MRNKLAILILASLCAVGLRAQQPPGYPYVGFWSATNQTFFTNAQYTNGQGAAYTLSGAGQPLLGGGLPTNWLATNSGMTMAPVTNLNLLGQKNITFALECQVLTNQGAGNITATVSNLVVPFQISFDYAIWNFIGQASNALWITDTNYVLSFPLVSNNAAISTGWTNFGWTNFNVQGIQAIRPGTNIVNTSTNFIVTNLWLEYLYK